MNLPLPILTMPGAFMAGDWTDERNDAIVADYSRCSPATSLEVRTA
jgi:hypothetical protein